MENKVGKKRESNSWCKSKKAKTGIIGCCRVLYDNQVQRRMQYVKKVRMEWRHKFK